MNKINLYLFNTANKYIFINFIIISILILFIHSIELSRLLSDEENNLLNFLYLLILKFPSILNEIIPFVIIISIAFLIRNLVTNNELISMRNIGYSIFDIFLPISFSVFLIGLIFLFFLNPISVLLESKYDQKLEKNESSLHSIKVTDNQMWIKNEMEDENYNFINVKNINLQSMYAQQINILIINNLSKKFIVAENGTFKNNLLELNNVYVYDFINEEYTDSKKFDLLINFNKENIINSISKYKLIPFYKYISHIQTLNKFNLYSSEIGIFYLSELMKPIFMVVLSFVILGFSGKFNRNENFFKVLFISMMVGFSVYLFKEVVTKISVTLSLNFILSYFMIILFPFLIGLYQTIKIEND